MPQPPAGRNTNLLLKVKECLVYRRCMLCNIHVCSYMPNYSTNESTKVLNPQCCCKIRISQYHSNTIILMDLKSNYTCFSPSTWPEVYTTGSSAHYHFTNLVILYLQVSKLGCLNSCYAARVKVVVHLPVTFCVCTCA